MGISFIIHLDSLGLKLFDVILATKHIRNNITTVDAVGVDETVDPDWAARELPGDMPVQGNLDPLLLLSGGAELERQTLRVLDVFADRPHVFNLGHGIGQPLLRQHEQGHVQVFAAAREQLLQQS